MTEQAMIVDFIAGIVVWLIAIIISGVAGYKIGKNKGYKEVLRYVNKERAEKNYVGKKDKQVEEDGDISSCTSECGCCGTDRLEFEPHEQSLATTVNRDGKLHQFDDVLRERNTRGYQ